MRRRRVRVSAGPSRRRRRREGDEMEVLEEQIWELMALQQREDIEALLGVPLPNIPAIISALWRIDSLFLNVGITLILSSLFSLHRTDPLPHLLSDTAPIFFLVALGHAAVSVFWLVGMRGLGAPVTTYVSLFVGLGSFFWGLGSWRALV
ncbi:hypothetical protein BDY24DRAFT_390914 [Mrakia frigida]|uniref:uncharacterized protein n=1 Tax=Mrakia frigida TaxID=29902 RepID=UPI003FCBF616